MYGKTKKDISQLTRENLKEFHKKEIFLHAIKSGSDEYSGISKAELTAKLKLSFPSVSALVDEMIGEGILRETGELETNARGRPRMLIGVRSDYIHVPVLELGKNGYRLVLYDIYGRILEEDLFPFNRSSVDIEWHPTIDELISPAVKAIKSVEGRFHLSDVPLSLPGNFKENGQFTSSSILILSPPNFIGSLENAIGHRVLTINRADSFAYAERIYSNASDNYIYLHISHGVGAGIIRNGRVFESQPWRAGEIGHMSVDFGGPKCRCGSRGCLELYISTDVIADECAEFTGGIADFNKVADNYILGETRTEEVINRKAELLASTLNNIFAMHSVTNVIIGGKIIELGNKFLNLLDNEISQKISRMYRDKFTTILSKNHSDDSTVGAFHNYLNNIFKI